VVEYNHVFDIAQDGINLCCGSTGGTVQFNEVHDNSSENAAIYVYGSTDMLIQCNLVYDVYDNDGIKLGSKNGGDAALAGGSIRYNVVHDTAQDGIAVYISDTLVDGNEVYNSTSENGAIYLAYEISNIRIVDNNVHDNTLDPRKWGDPGGIMVGTAVNAATVAVNNNNITNNTVNGVTNKATAQLDAENNWWGAVGGPSGAGPGSGDGVSTNVDFNPWLTEEAVPQGQNPCVGTIIVEKQTDPDGAPDSFTFSGGAAGTISDGQQIVVSGLQPGTYTSTEIEPAGWDLTSIVCDDNNSSGDVNTRTATFRLEAGETVKCTFYNEQPTAITLASFTAQAGVGSVTLAWETATEVDNAGFNLYRAMVEGGPYTQINDGLIAAEGDPVSGASYSFADRPDYGTFYYKLEDVDYNGVSTLHGPVRVTLARPLRRPPHRPTLPALW